jgi:hypothetical protein
MSVVVRGKSFNCSFIAPAMVFGVTVRKRDEGSAVVSAVRPIEKGVFSHENAKIRPANAVGTDVHE